MIYDVYDTSLKDHTVYKDDYNGALNRIWFRSRKTKREVINEKFKNAIENNLSVFCVEHIKTIILKSEVDSASKEILSDLSNYSIELLRHYNDQLVQEKEKNLLFSDEEYYGIWSSRNNRKK
jgi:hypothetical protein